MLSLENWKASFPQPKWHSWRTRLWSVGILFHLSKRPAMESGLLQEHVLEFQNVQATLDQCRLQYGWHFVPDTSLLCGAALCIVGGLAASLTSVHYMLGAALPSVVTTQNVFRLCQMVLGTKLFLVESLCPRSYRSQMPYLRFSFSFHFTPRKHLSLFQVIKRQVGVLCKWRCVSVLSLFQNLCFTTESLLPQVFLHSSLGKWKTAGHHHPYDHLTPI